MRALKEIISAGAHPVRPPLTQSGCFLHGCAELNSFVVGPEKLVLSLSLLRHLDRNAINNCKIIPRPGKTYRTMDEEIRRGKINIANFKVIAFLLGTNDIDGAVYCKYGIVGYKRQYRKPILPKRFVDMDSVKNDFLRLMDTVQTVNSHATILILGLLPRLGDWVWSKALCIELNDFLQVWCCEQVAEGRRAIFFPGYKFFQKGGEPLREYYRWDGVHLSNEGLVRAKQFLQQALADSNIKRGGVWKRHPAGWAFPGLRTPKVQGNLIIF